jgi:alpha-mannosidase
LQRWVDVSDAERGVTLVPLDAPLVHLGGITTGKWSRTLEAETPTIMSWALNNHWMVNFKASQEGRIPLRYRLATHTGSAVAAAAARYAAEVSVPPVVLRDIAPTAARTESFFSIERDAPILVTAKPGEAKGTVALRVQNLSREKIAPALTFGQAPKSASRSDPIERQARPIGLDGKTLSVELEPLAIATVLVNFGT